VTGTEDLSARLHGLVPSVDVEHISRAGVKRRVKCGPGVVIGPLTTASGPLLPLKCGWTPQSGRTDRLRFQLYGQASQRELSAAMIGVAQSSTTGT
jgi:hypothetical protein